MNRGGAEGGMLIRESGSVSGVIEGCRLWSELLKPSEDPMHKIWRDMVRRAQQRAHRDGMSGDEWGQGAVGGSMMFHD